MKLVLKVPARVEYPLEISQSPESLEPGDTVTLRLTVVNPETRAAVKNFEIVHEKLVHLFVVSENLEFFAHVHPVWNESGFFSYEMKLPLPGMYRLLADFYPSGSVPQLAAGTIFVSGTSSPAKITPSLAPQVTENLRTALRLEPERPIAGEETKLFFSLDPKVGLELYLGAWAHMVCASVDLIDLLHIHPSLVPSPGNIQFNIIFPRPGNYRLWTQFQRSQIVNTTVFTIPVRAL